jgi:hypothetical protein
MIIVLLVGWWAVKTTVRITKWTYKKLLKNRADTTVRIE